MARAASDGITVAGEPATRTRVATRVRWPALLPPVMTAAMSLALADVAPAQTTGAAATGVLADAERSLASGSLGSIEIAAAWKVVVEVQISTQSLPTFEAGRKSRTLLAVSVLRVVEVWASPKKCLWRASETPGAAAAGSPTFDMNTGRIAAPKAA